MYSNRESNILAKCISIQHIITTLLLSHYVRMLLHVSRETVHISATYIFALLGGGVEGGASSSSGPTLLPPSPDFSFLLKEEKVMECTYSHCTATLHLYSSCAVVPASLVKYG